MKTRYCCNCGKELAESYFTCVENYLITKFFDSEEDNTFCSKDCFCEALMLYEKYIDEESEEEENGEY